MVLTINFRISLFNVLKTKHISFFKRNVSTTPSLLWLNQRLTRSFKKNEQHFLEKDKVPQNYQLIYKAPMESYVAWAIHVSTVTAGLIGAAATYQFATGEKLSDPIDITTLPMESGDIGCFAAGFLAINAALRLVVSMFPLRIYKDQNKYLAVYHPQLPLGISHNHFKKGQVKAVFYMFSPWNNITYKLGQKSSLLLPDYFKTPSEFHEMQGLELKK